MRSIDPFWKPNPTPDRLQEKLRGSFVVEPLPPDLAALAEAIAAAMAEDGAAADEPSRPWLPSAVLVGTK